jgi:hypothetical protein
MLKYLRGTCARDINHCSACTCHANQALPSALHHCSIAAHQPFFFKQRVRQAAKEVLRVSTLAGDVSSVRTVMRKVFGRSMTPGE